MSNLHASNSVSGQWLIAAIGMAVGTFAPWSLALADNPIAAPASPVAATAQIVPADSQAIPQTCLRELESESIESRDKASSTLRNWAKGSPDRLLALLTSDSTPEQRERVLALAFEAFNASPRAALGVSFGQLALRQNALGGEEVFEEGIPIESTLTGFDSGRVLKGGDLLRSIGGVRVRTNLQCRTEIISYDPGQQVRLEIEREGRPTFVTVRLGRWNDLQATGQSALVPTLRQAAWKSRIARSTSVPITDGVAIQPLPGALAWVEGDRLVTPAPDNQALVRDANFRVKADPQPQLALLPGPNDQFTLERTESPAADMVGSGGPRTKVPAAQTRNYGRRADPNRDALAVAVQQFRQQLQGIDQQLEISREALRNPQLTPQERTQHLERIDALETQRDATDLNISRLQEILRPR